MDRHNIRVFQAFFKDFLGSNRQYSTYQHDYCKKHLPEFKVVDISGCSSPKDQVLQDVTAWLLHGEEAGVNLSSPSDLHLEPTQKLRFEKELHKVYDSQAQLTNEELREIERRLRSILQLQSYQGLFDPIF